MSENSIRCFSFDTAWSCLDITTVALQKEFKGTAHKYENTFCKSYKVYAKEMQEKI